MVTVQDRTSVLGQAPANQFTVSSVEARMVGADQSTSLAFNASSLEDQSVDAKLDMLMREVQQNAAEVKKEINQVREEVVKVKKAVGRVKKEVTTVKNEVVEVRHDIADVSREFDENAGDVLVDIWDARKGMREVKKEVDQVKQGISEIRSKVDNNAMGVSGNFDQVKTETDQTKQDISEVKRGVEVNAAESEEIDQVKEYADEVKEDIDQVEGELGQVEGELGQVEEELGQVEAKDNRFEAKFRDTRDAGFGRDFDHFTKFEGWGLRRPNIVTEAEVIRELTDLLPIAARLFVTDNPQIRYESDAENIPYYWQDQFRRFLLQIGKGLMPNHRHRLERTPRDLWFGLLRTGLKMPMREFY